MASIHIQCNTFLYPFQFIRKKQAARFLRPVQSVFRRPFLLCGVQSCPYGRGHMPDVGGQVPADAGQAPVLVVSRHHGPAPGGVAAGDGLVVQQVAGVAQRVGVVGGTVPSGAAARISAPMEEYTSAPGGGMSQGRASRRSNTIGPSLGGSQRGRGGTGLPSSQWPFIR